MTFKSYLEGDNWGTHSYALYRAFHNIQGVCSDVYKLDGVEVGFYSTDIYQRLSEVVDFIKHAIDLLEKYKEKVHTKRRRREAQQPSQSGLSDVLAGNRRRVEIIFHALRSNLLLRYRAGPFITTPFGPRFSDPITGICTNSWNLNCGGYSITRSHLRE